MSILSRNTGFDGVPDLPEDGFRVERVGRRAQMKLFIPSGGSAPSTQTVEQRSIPDWMVPYYTDEGGLLPTAYQEFFGREYTPYLGERVAGFTPSQQAAQQGIMGMTAPSGLAAAGQTFADVASQAAGQQYAPTEIISRYVPTTYSRGYQASPITTGYEAGQITSGYDAGEFTPEVAARMMDPYMQNVLDVERSKAIEAYEKGRAGTAAEAIRAGAFGGGRFGVREAEAQRGLESQLAEIQTKGMQQAYEQARQQFATEEAARQQAAQMGLTAQQQTELARQRQEEFGMSAQQQTEALRQAEAQQRMAIEQAQDAARQQAEAFRQQAAGMTESSQQFAAQYGQQGLDLAMRAGQAQQDLAAAEQGLEMARLQAQQAVGAEQQRLAQAQLDQAYADFRNAEDFSRQNIAAMGAVLGGTPMPVSQESYATGSTSPLAQIGGTGLTALALAQAMGQG